VSPILSRHSGRQTALVLVLLLTSIGVLAVHNLDYPGVWYDEAVQIWIAHGTYPMGPVGAAPGGWRDVVRMNRRANLDPGGYSLWLHFWATRGYGLVWLRLSTFVFFLAMTGLLALWAFELTGSAVASCLASFIPLGYGLVVSYAFEIRAYSLEVLGVVATAYALHRVVRHPGLLNHMILGCVCSVFLWSRYSFAVTVAAALCSLACVRARRVGRSREELENLACLLVPLLNSGALVYRFMLRHQTDRLRIEHPSSVGAAAATIQAPEYVRQWLLRGQSLETVTTVLRENFLTPPAIPILLTFGLLVAWPFMRQRRRLTSWPGLASFPAIATMALLAQLFSAALSLAGWYPWYLGQKWSLYLHAISIVCALYVAAAWWHLVPQSRAAAAVAAVPIAVAVLLAIRGVAFHRTHWADVSAALTQLEAMPLRSGSVFVVFYDVPTVRYFYELGPHRGQGPYPDVFRFEGVAESAVVDARKECLEYVVSPLEVAALSQRLPGVRLTRVSGSASTSLSRIDGVLPAHCAARDVVFPRP
jgi:hypothetical protein